MKTLKREKALQAESGGLRDTIWLLRDAYIWWNQWEGKESLHWGKQRQEGRNRMVCGVGERALGTWCMRIWRHISIDLRQNLRERTWMPDLPLDGLGHLAREVGGLCVETMTWAMIQTGTPRREPLLWLQAHFALAWEEARWSRALSSPWIGAFRWWLSQLLGSAREMPWEAWQVGELSQFPLQTINEDLSHIWAEQELSLGKWLSNLRSINHLINQNTCS